jgi:hypothetical protein
MKAPRNKRRITGRVSAAENEKLKDYAERLGLQKAQLVNILVLRALYGTNDPGTAFDGREQVADVTIMLPVERDHEDFRMWAEDLDIKAGPLVARIVRRELREKWLATMVFGEIVT